VNSRERNFSDHDLRVSKMNIKLYLYVECPLLIVNGILLFSIKWSRFCSGNKKFNEHRKCLFVKYFQR